MVSMWVRQAACVESGKADRRGSKRLHRDRVGEKTHDDCFVADWPEGAGPHEAFQRPFRDCDSSGNGWEPPRISSCNRRVLPLRPKRRVMRAKILFWCQDHRTWWVNLPKATASQTEYCWWSARVPSSVGCWNLLVLARPLWANNAANAELWEHWTMRVEELARPGGRPGRVCPLLWRDRVNDRTRSHSGLYVGRVWLPEELRYPAWHDWRTEEQGRRQQDQSGPRAHTLQHS